MSRDADKRAAFDAAAAKYFGLKEKGLNRTPEGLAAFDAMVDTAPQDVFDKLLERAVDHGLIPQRVADDSTAFAISGQAIERAKGGAS